MKKVIIIMLVIIIGGAFLYADEGDFFLSEKTVERLGELSSKFDEITEEKFAEDSVADENGAGFYAKWLTFVSEDSNILLEKLIINGKTSYYATVFHPEEMEHYEVIIPPGSRMLFIFLNNETSGSTPVNPTEGEIILNKIMDAFNEATDIKIDNERRRDAIRGVLEGLMKKWLREKAKRELLELFAPNSGA